MLKLGPIVALLLRGAIKNNDFDFIGDVVGAIVDEVPEMLRDLRNVKDLSEYDRVTAVSKVVLEAVDDVFDEIPVWGQIDEARRDALLDAIYKLVAVTSALDDADSKPGDETAGDRFKAAWDDAIGPALREVGAFIADAIENSKSSIANPAARRRRKGVRFGRTFEPGRTLALGSSDEPKVKHPPLVDATRLRRRVELAAGGAAEFVRVRQGGA